MLDLKHLDTIRQAGPIPTEDQEQAWLIQWALRNRGQYPELVRLFHIPNGGSRSKMEGARLKLTGVKPGVPDLCLPVPRYGRHGLYIELKALSATARPSKEQKDWMAFLGGQGYAAHVCRGFEEARDVILNYLDPVVPCSPGVI